MWNTALYIFRQYCGMKRKHKEVRKAVLKILKDNKEHSYGNLERKVNTNWKTIRNHCEDLELFNCIKIAQNKKS